MEMNPPKETSVFNNKLFYKLNIREEYVSPYAGETEAERKQRLASIVKRGKVEDNLKLARDLKVKTLEKAIAKLEEERQALEDELFKIYTQEITKEYGTRND